MDKLDALGDPDLRETLLLVRGAPSPVTAAEVADQLDVPRSAARWRLERLADAGLLATSFERRSGRAGPGAGRPAKLYAAAPETAAIEFPARRYEALVRTLIGAVPHRGLSRRLREVGHEFGAELARAARLRPAATTPTALRRVCSALGRLGFQATVESITANEAIIVSRTCPLRPIVIGDPAARAIDEGMWSGLIAAAVRGAEPSGIVCGTHNCLDGGAPCRIVVALPHAAG